MGISFVHLFLWGENVFTLDSNEHYFRERYHIPRIPCGDHLLVCVLYLQALFSVVFISFYGFRHLQTRAFIPAGEIPLVSVGATPSSPR
jgi:hypothetical protein